MPQLPRISNGVKKIILLVSLSLILAFGITISAQGADFSMGPSTPGRIAGTGTYFEITDSEYLNVSLKSSEEITILLESLPKTISLHIIEASTSANSTTLTIGGLETNKTYYKFEDSYKNRIVFTADNIGSYTWLQDLTQPHHIWIQPEDDGTVFLPEDCSTYGIWDELTSTCTLTQDLSEGVEIAADNITLDCDDYKIIGSDTGYGIYLNKRTGIVIKDCIAAHFFQGIYLGGSSNDNTLTGNDISSNGLGILLHDSSRNTLIRNVVSNSQSDGIWLWNSSYNTLTDNNASDNWHGIYLGGSSNYNTLTDNDISSNELGILLYDSNSNTLLNNAVSNSQIDGIWLGNSSNNILTNNNTSDNSIGINLDHSSNNTLTDNTANSNNQYGIHLDHSSNNNTFTNNSALHNSHCGIHFVYSSDNNTLTGNTANSNNQYGIHFGSSSSNTLFNNTVSNNNYGIFLEDCQNSKVYHNNFIKNYLRQAQVAGGSGNLFDNGYPEGGNYWSDYIGVDLYSGPNQDQPGSDGTGDTPYTFLGGEDRYPFMEESGWEVPPIPEVETTHNYTLSSLWASPIAEPVNPVFGNYLYQERDLSIPGRGLPLIFERTYNSQSTEDSSLGAKWTHSYNIYLKIFPQAVVFVDADGRQDLFTLNPDGTYTPQKSVYNQLVKNPDNTFTLIKKNQTKLNFSPEGKLLSIIDRNNNETSLTYNLNNQLIQVTEPSGRSLNFTLDSQGRIIKITDPLNQEYIYEYDGSGNLISYTDPTSAKTQYFYDQNHNLVSIVDVNNHTLVTNTYNEESQVISQLDAKNNQSNYQYFTDEKLTVFIDALSNQTKYYWDENYRIVKQVNTQEGKILYIYDENNNRTSITDANNHAINFIYDENGNLTSLTDSLNNILYFTYDNKNNLLSSTNAKGDTTNFFYDQNSNLIKITDPYNNQTLFTYDQYGQLIQKQDAKDNITEYEYDQYGNLEIIIDALNNTTTFNYDILSRLVSITDAQENTAYSEYDQVGRLIKITDPLGKQTSFEYDGVGNLIEIADAKGNITEYFYDTKNYLEKVNDSLGNIAQYQYDGLDNRIKVIDANNHETSYTYDSLNRLIKVIDSLEKTTGYSYDPVGNVINFTNGEGEIITYRYDPNNRLIKKIFPSQEETIFEYDENGNITKAQNVDVTYTYQYDKLNRLTTFNDARFGTINYTYDEIGNRISLTDPQNLTTTYQYDSLNRLTRITDSQSQSYTFEYDSLSRREELTLPNDLTTHYSYDSADRLLSLITKNQRNKVISQYLYTYDELGNRLTKQEKKKVTNYQYDALSRLLEASTGVKFKCKKKPWLKENYTYDSVGNRLDGPKKQTYDYNTANELLQLNYDHLPFDISFEYDLNGNIVEKQEKLKTWNYEYDPENRLIGVTKSLKTKKIIKPIENISYVYDPFGRRIEKKIEKIRPCKRKYCPKEKATIEQYLYDNEDILYIFDNKGRTISRFVHGPGIDEPLSVTQKKKTYYYLYDGLGSVVGLTDKRGRIIQKYEYDSFGRMKWKFGRIKQPYAFIGREYDKETGLYFYRARYYDTEVGRFISRDVFGGFLEIPQSLNSYSYVMNNPVNLVDPQGMGAREFAMASLMGSFKFTEEKREILIKIMEDFLTLIILIKFGPDPFLPFGPLLPPFIIPYQHKAVPA